MGCELPVLRLRRDRLMHAARKILGSDEKARAWMKAPNASFDQRAPEDLADTLDGFQQALAELESIE